MSKTRSNRNVKEQREKVVRLEAGVAALSRKRDKTANDRRSLKEAKAELKGERNVLRNLRSGQRGGTRRRGRRCWN